MALAVGSKLGSYEIVAPIGAGGMGEVYRARDPKLNRDVAIKTLPDALVAEPERLARFRREAQLLASLNHPHIAAIYGLEEVEGRPFLVLELVEGEDLAAILKRGPMPVEDAIALARQVAEALEAAHEKGVVHRDLKPANIKLTADGKIKVLDFGLAKALAREPTSVDLSQSPTQSRQATEAGMVLGTAAYMSPEQARGKAVDKRTDLWAFGCVLFEMLTGRKVFEGETVTDVLAAVVKNEPEWSALPAKTPASTRGVLRRCLKKSSDERLRDAGDARLLLGEGDEPLAEPSETAPSSRRQLVAVATVAALVAAVLGWLAASSFTRGESMPVIRLATAVGAGEDLATVRSGIAVSPDGTTVAYSEARGLYLRSLSEFVPRPIPGTEGASGAFFSPDGEGVAFFDATGLQKIRLSGGEALTLSGRTSGRLGMGLLRTGIWGEDDVIVFAGPSATCLRVSADGGEPEEITSLDAERGEVGHYWPELLPGGRTLLYTAVVMPADRRDIVAKSLDTGEVQVVMERGTSPRYVPTGHLLFERDGTLFAAPFDADRLEVTGDPFPVVDDLDVVVYGNFTAAQYDVSDSGTLAYLEEGLAGRIGSLVWVDRRGEVTPVTEEEARDAYVFPRIAPDGRRIAFAAVDEQTGQRDLWVLDPRRGTRTRLTFGEGLSTDPVWHPDGRTLAFASTRVEGQLNLFSMAADGTGESLLLTETANRLIFPRQWLSDGSALLYQVVAAGQDIGILHPSSDGDGEAREQILLGDGEIFEFLEPSLSPGGQWLAYVSNESGRREVYVLSYPDLARRSQISSDGGEEPAWSANGRELFYRNGDRMMTVAIDPNSGADLTAGRPTLLFEGVYEIDPFGNDARNYDVTPDGERFLMIRPETDPSLSQRQLNTVLNWFEELKRIDPNR